MPLKKIYQEDDAGRIIFKGRSYKIKMPVSKDMIAHLERCKKKFLAKRMADALEAERERN